MQPVGLPGRGKVQPVVDGEADPGLPRPPPEILEEGEAAAEGPLLFAELDQATPSGNHAIQNLAEVAPVAGRPVQDHIQVELESSPHPAQLRCPSPFLLSPAGGGRGGGGGGGEGGGGSTR